MAMLRKHLVTLGFTAAAALAAMSAVASTSSPPHVDTSGINMQPAYPETARPNKESGAVVIDATVKADGSVKRVKLYRSSGFDDLDNAAANTVRNWKFVPAMDNGVATEGSTKVQLVFQPPADSQ